MLWRFIICIVLLLSLIPIYDALGFELLSLAKSLKYCICKGLYSAARMFCMFALWLVRSAATFVFYTIPRWLSVFKASTMPLNFTPWIISFFPRSFLTYAAYCTKTVAGSYVFVKQFAVYLTARIARGAVCYSSCQSFSAFVCFQTPGALFTPCYAALQRICATLRAYSP
eukprot:IDg4569t1